MDRLQSIKYVALSGGGMKSLAICGAEKAFEEYGIDLQIKGLIGTSAGAIVAGLFSIGYRSKDIQAILENTDFNTFKDSSYSYLGMLYRFINYFGLYQGDAFETWFENLVEKKTQKRDITFQEVFEKFGIDLVVVGTCLSKRRAVYFNIENTPQMPISKAVRISMSYPLVFKPVIMDGLYYVDGGLTKNYDLHYFIRKYPNTSPPETIGLKLMAADEVPNKHIYSGTDKIDNVIDFSQDLIEAMQYQIDREYMSASDWKNSILVNTGNISSMDFNLTIEQKQFLIKSGYDATKAYIENILKEQN